MRQTVSLNGNFSIAGDELGLLHEGFRIAQMTREEYLSIPIHIQWLGLYFYKSRPYSLATEFRPTWNSFKILTQMIALDRILWTIFKECFVRCSERSLKRRTVIWNALPPFIWSLVINFFPRVIDSRQSLNSRVTDPVISSSFPRDRLEILYTHTAWFGLQHDYWKWRCSLLIKKILSPPIVCAFFSDLVRLRNFSRRAEEIRDDGRFELMDVMKQRYTESSLQRHSFFFFLSFKPVHDVRR